MANARTPKQVHDAKVSLVLNTTLGVAAMKFPKLGLPGFAKGITDEYGPQIMGGAMQLLIDGQKDSNAYIRAPNNDLEKAFEASFVGYKALRQ